MAADPPAAPPATSTSPAERASLRDELLRDREVAAVRRRRRGLSLRAPSSMPVPEKSAPVPESPPDVPRALSAP